MELRYEKITSSSPLLDMIRKIKPLDLNGGGWVAGGAAMRILGGLAWPEGSDIDVFCKDENQGAEIFKNIESAFSLNYLESPLFGYRSRFEKNGNGRLVAHGKTLQVIRKTVYKDVEALLESIDFTICRVATDGVSVVYDCRAKDDIENRWLRRAVNKTTSVTCSRVAKYVKYGFIPEPGIVNWALGLDKKETTLSENMKVSGWDEY